MFNRSTIAKVKITADKLGVEAAALLAVGEVESAGVTVWNVKGAQMPPMRFEGHYFYRLLKGNKAKLQQAIKAGLASPRPGAVRNPASYEARYALLDRAKKIDAASALASCSWGLGQVMGIHWQKLGYGSVQALVAEASSGVEGQIGLMARYIQRFGLVDELQAKGWQSFADQYNGPASRKNRYSEKIAAAYGRYSKLLALPDDASPHKVDEVLDSGATQVQKDLKRLGYYNGPINGKFGPLTTAAIKTFQRDHGLSSDGKYGPMTDDLVDAEVAKLNEGQADKAVAGGGATSGITVATEVIRDQTSQFESISYYTQSPIVTGVIIFLMVAGILLTVYGLYVKFYKKKGVE